MSDFCLTIGQFTGFNEWILVLAVQRLPPTVRESRTSDELKKKLQIVHSTRCECRFFFLCSGSEMKKVNATILPLAGVLTPERDTRHWKIPELMSWGKPRPGCVYQEVLHCNHFCNRKPLIMHDELETLPALMLSSGEVRSLAPRIWGELNYWNVIIY